MAALLLSLGRLRVFARVLGILGVAAIMLPMFVIHEQTIRTKVGEYITVTRSRYPRPTRFQIRVALLGLPAAATLVMIWVANSARRRLRATVPHHLREGRKLLAQGAYQAALAEFNSALAISPYLADALFHRGCLHEVTGQVEVPWQTSIGPCTATLSMRSLSFIVVGSVARRETSIPLWQTSIG